MALSGLRRRLSARWRYALLGGLVALPFTALSYAQSGEELKLGAVFWAALLVGYLARRRGLSGTPVGARAGLVGALPVLWQVGDIATFVVGLGGPAWFRTVQLAVVAVVVPLAFGLAAVAGALGGRLGGWLAERNGHPRRPAGSGA
ncbi:DUF5518 domain-containing protein [Haloarcula onubensis]|uniref:DUF5518 domain-containing protein n=1 Tax=Haloarcula onubensis TaxID=2950539 RepID=A0ABU2FJ82_9EURY|nr:DUF5518 domain-containing protein [Halomicroarcula sp. S3CR25-11]MDS0280820.1 DUF5518 domain-containing protein [Halomicroarcula sp. S3CR25-11]